MTEVMDAISHWDGSRCKQGAISTISMCIVQVLQFTSRHKERKVENGDWIKVIQHIMKRRRRNWERRGIYCKKSTRLWQIIPLSNMMVKKIATQYIVLMWETRRHIVPRFWKLNRFTCALCSSQRQRQARPKSSVSLRWQATRIQGQEAKP